jgi:hypothetical protein
MQRSDLKPQQFRVVRDATSSNGWHAFDIGDILVLAYDDGSDSPDFLRVSDGERQFVHLDDVEVVE